MKKINLSNVMTEETMAMLSDEYNAHMFRTDILHHGDLEDKIVTGKLQCKLVGGKDEVNEVSGCLITLIASLNLAFNRCFGLNEGTALFKILDIHAKYAGNNTICVSIKMATVANGSSTILVDLLKPVLNIWKTNASLFEFTDMTVSDKTYGLGNVLRSWKRVMREFAGNDVNVHAAYQYLFLTR